MEVLSTMQKDIYQIIGYQDYDFSVDYKEIPYIVKQKNKDGLLLCNILTREIVFAPFFESKEEVKEFLVKHWYLIPHDIDPSTLRYILYQQHKFKYRLKKPKKLEQITIFTTTECNARCYYCYESGCKKRSMNHITAIDVSKFICEKGNKNNLFLKWFGGEPLCNVSVIDIICQYLQKNNYSYSSMMVTNGILIDEQNIKKIKNLWKLSRVQITLDGTKDEYEKIKNYVGIVDSYDRVLNNIHLLLKEGIRVDIRLNLSKKNYEDLNLLAQNLAERFGSYKEIFTVYSHTLFETENGSFSSLEKENLYNNYIELQKNLNILGIGGNFGLPMIRHTNCMADNGKSIVVLPGGELSLCEHHCDDEYVGTIYDSEWDLETINRWREVESKKEECKKCFWYPACHQLKMCPGKPTCSLEWKNCLKKRIKTMIEKKYLEKIEGKGKKVEDNNI